MFLFFSVFWGYYIYVIFVLFAGRKVETSGVKNPISLHC